jgi:hypothetical protein
VADMFDLVAMALLVSTLSSGLVVIIVINLIIIVIVVVGLII